MTNPLATRTQTPQSLSETQTAQLYALYATYYGGTSPELFQRDLQEKDQILILQDGNTPVGFTTLKIIRAEHQNQPVRAVFSGDTIIHHSYWGSHTAISTCSANKTTPSAKSPPRPKSKA